MLSEARFSLWKKADRQNRGSQERDLWGWTGIEGISMNECFLVCVCVRAHALFTVRLKSCDILVTMNMPSARSWFLHIIPH